jgi:GMP synthase (glutamine-hydrolysing)
MSSAAKRYLFVKHSENWNVDRCTRWMEEKQINVDWCYPVSDQPFPDPENYAGIIVFGGANSANDCDCHDWVRRELVFVEQCLKLDRPYFGICLGAQILARVLGATVRPHDEEIKEVGFCRVDPEPEHSHFLDEPLTVMQWHSEGFDIPPGTQRIATGEEFPNQAYSLSEKILGVQFHPEVNAEVLAIWHERNRLRKPGQLSDDDRARMMSDAHTHDASVTRWLDGFLTQWTGSS